MKKENKKTKKNQSADYYSEDVYDFGSVYGFENSKKTDDNKNIPLESWGWTNNSD